MKGKFKVLVIIAMLALIGFSMASCGGDTKEIYGCAYSDSVDIKINMYDGSLASVTHYLLTISFDQAKAKVIQKLGPGEASDPIMLQTGSTLSFNSTGVILEVTKYSNSAGASVRLAQLPMGGKGHSWWAD